MGDRTYYTVDFDGDGLSEKALDRLVEDLEFDRWDYNFGDPSSVQLVDEERSCGDAEWVATAVLEWMKEKPKKRLRAFTVVESPKYEWLGTQVIFDPKVHSPEEYHVVICDDGGEALLGESNAARMVAEAAGSFEALSAALAEHYGPNFQYAVAKHTPTP